MSFGPIHRMKAVIITAMLSALATTGVVAVAGSTAQAIPSYERHCALDFRRNVTSWGWQPVGSSVRVNNGNVSRLVVVNFNADANVQPDAWIRIGYKIDAGPIITAGAEHFAGMNTPSQQARHSMAVLFVPRGLHRITPYWKIVGSSGKWGYIDNRCLTAEAHTS